MVLMRPSRLGLGHTKISLLSEMETEIVTELLISSRAANEFCWMAQYRKPKNKSRTLPVQIQNTGREY